MTEARFQVREFKGWIGRRQGQNLNLPHVLEETDHAAKIRDHERFSETQKVTRLTRSI